MAHKQRGHDRSSGGNRSPKRAQKTTRTDSMIRGTRKQTVFMRRGEELQARSPDLSRFRSPLGPIDPAKLSRDTRTRIVNAVNEWRENPDWSLSKVAKRWHLDTRSFH